VHTRQLYGSGPLQVSTGLDIMNAGESSSHYGVDAPQLWSEARKGVVPTQDKSRRTHALHGLSSL
jgi:hypothetical protein